MRRARPGVIVLLPTPDEPARELGRLHPAERALATSLPPVRQREWIGGRLALRHALREQALDRDEPLLRDDRGAPQLPAGALGSITHKGAWVAALAAPHQPGWALGIDLEAARPPRVDLSARVLTDRELGALAGLAGDERGRAVTLRFSIKEAIYKAIDPRVRRYVGFREVEVDVHPGGLAVARIVDDRLRGELGPVALELEWTELEGHWLCTAVARGG